MSDTDSFIDEVSEEVRRDRLFGLIKRYGWIAVLLVLVLVGGTAWNEYRKAQARTAAEAFGDSVLAILENGTPQTQPIALSELTVPPKADPVMQLLIAATQMGNTDPKAAAEVLTPMAADQSISIVYRDLAALKLSMLGGDVVSPDQRSALLEQVIVPGAPYRLLGLEQQILSLITDAKIDEAIAAAQALLQETGVSVGLQQRLVQLIVALGGDITPTDAG